MSDLVDLLLPAAEPGAGLDLIFGTVVASGGVTTVRVDNDTDPLPAPPVTLTPLIIGERVAMVLSGRTLVVVGRVNRTSSCVIPSVADLNTYVVPGQYIQRVNTGATIALNYPIALAGLLEVFADPVDGSFIWQRYTVYAGGNGTEAASSWHGAVYQRQFFRGAGAGWTPWVLTNSRMVGGMTFSVSGTFVANGAWNPLINFPVNPTASWGDTSWRTSTNDASAVFVKAGTYRLDARMSYARSGDSSTFCVGGVRPNSGGWFRPMYLGIGQPNNRILGGISSSGSSMGDISGDAIVGALVTTTAVSAEFTIERIGP